MSDQSKTQNQIVLNQQNSNSQSLSIETNFQPYQAFVYQQMIHPQQPQPVKRVVENTLVLDEQNEYVYKKSKKNQKTISYIFDGLEKEMIVKQPQEAKGMSLNAVNERQFKDDIAFQNSLLISLLNSYCAITLKAYKHSSYRSHNSAIVESISFKGDVVEVEKIIQNNVH